jgi:hypothetical protein
MPILYPIYYYVAVKHVLQNCEESLKCAFLPLENRKYRVNAKRNVLFQPK